MSHCAYWLPAARRDPRGREHAEGDHADAKAPTTVAVVALVKMTENPA